MKKTLIAALCAGAIAIPAFAIAADQAGKPGMRMDEPMTRAAVETMVKDRFAKLDANGDGFVTKSEADAARDKMVADMRDRHFKHLDANNDGSISRAEFDAQAGAHMAFRDGNRAEGAPDAPPPPAGGGEHGKRMWGKGGHGHHRGAMVMGGGMFERADADKDGRVSLAEALARPMQHFDMVDANKDGTITPEERKAAREKMRTEWRARRS